MKPLVCLDSRLKKAWAPIERVMQYLYFMLVRVLFLDTWLLSRASSAREHLKGRRSKLIWLIMLPPLLLGGESLKTSEMTAAGC